MTDLSTREPRPVVTFAPAPAAAELIEWAQAAKQAYAIAEQLADTSFVPKVMYRKPGDVCGAILAGSELGLPPMSALRSIDIIDGSPAMRAIALRGLVLHHGHQIWIEESTEHRAIVAGQRAGSSHIERSTWTMDRARKAGLVGKKNWQGHPGAMLIARATAECARFVIPDVLIGMPYSIEEISDGIDSPDASAPAAIAPAPAKRTASRKPKEEPAPPPAEDIDWSAIKQTEPDEPPTDTPPDESPPVVEVVDALTILAESFEVEPIEPMISDPQRRRLAVGFKKIGIADRVERLAFASRVVGRELETSNDLTLIEATRVIGALIEAEQVAGEWAEPEGES